MKMGVQHYLPLLIVELWKVKLATARMHVASCCSLVEVIGALAIYRQYKFFDQNLYHL